MKAVPNTVHGTPGPRLRTYTLGQPEGWTRAENGSKRRIFSSPPFRRPGPHLKWAKHTCTEWKYLLYLTTSLIDHARTGRGYTILPSIPSGSIKEPKYTTTTLGSNTLEQLDLYMSDVKHTSRTRDPHGKPCPISAAKTSSQRCRP